MYFRLTPICEKLSSVPFVIIEIKLKIQDISGVNMKEFRDPDNLGIKLVQAIVFKKYIKYTEPQGNKKALFLLIMNTTHV